MENILHKETLLKSVIGEFKCTFYSTLKDTELLEKMSNALNVSIQIIQDFNTLRKGFCLYTNTLYDRFEIYGLKNQYTFGTPTMSYASLILILNNVMMFIKNEEKVCTHDYDGVILNMSIDNVQLTSLGANPISFAKLNGLNFAHKFIDVTNENEFNHKPFSFVPMKNAKSDFYIAMSKLNTDEMLNVFNFDNGIKYDLDLTGANNNIITVYSICGKDYENNVGKADNIINGIIDAMYDAAIHPSDLTYDDFKSIRDISAEVSYLKSNFENYELFRQKYENVHIFVDLSNDANMISTHFELFKDKLFKTLVPYGLLNQSISVNYDTDKSKLQLKDCIIDDVAYITDIDIIDCQLSGIFENCEIHNSEVKDSRIISCNLYGNEINDSIITESYISSSNTINKSIISGTNSIVLGTVVDSQIFDATIDTDMAEITNTVVMINR